MKINEIILLITVLFLSYNSSYSQNYEIQYEEFFVAVNGSLDYINTQLKQEAKTGKKEIEGIKTHLLYSDGVSIYKDVDENIETKDLENSSENELYMTRMIRPITYHDLNRNLYKKKYFNYSPRIYGEDILIEQSIPNLEWEITDTKEKVSGYNCKLAKTINPNGMPILVWFTDEIGLNAGPREYTGLPGLIIQAQINNAVLVVAKSIKRLDEKIEIKELMGGNKMTIDEFISFEVEMNKPRTVVLPDGREVRINQN